MPLVSAVATATPGINASSGNNDPASSFNRAIPSCFVFSSSTTCRVMASIWACAAAACSVLPRRSARLNTTWASSRWSNRSVTCASKEAILALRCAAMPDQAEPGNKSRTCML